MNRLYKSRTDKQLAGVCGGVAEYLNIDSTLVRIIVAALFFAGTLSLWVYIIAAIVMPEAPYDTYDRDDKTEYRDNE